MENYLWRCRVISLLENLTSPPTVTGLWRYGTLPSSGTPSSKPLKQGPEPSKGSSQMVEEESIGTKIRPSMPGTWNEHPLSRDILKKIYDYKAYNNANSFPNNDNGTWFSDAHIQLYRPVQAEIGGGSGDICGANPCNPNQDCGAAHTVRHCYSKWSMHHPRNTISLIFQNTICQKTAPHPACQKLPP